MAFQNFLYRRRNDGAKCTRTQANSNAIRYAMRINFVLWNGEEEENERSKNNQRKRETERMIRNKQTSIEIKLVVAVTSSEVIKAQELCERGDGPWLPSLIFPTVSVDFRAQELCESRGWRPGLPSLIFPTVFVDVRAQELCESRGGRPRLQYP